MKHNLIGISGKIGSGKDLVGLIIQALTTEVNTSGVIGQLGKDMINDPELCQQVASGGLWYGVRSYEIRKYADKLKDIVCLLLNCTREDLEDREFKEKELGEEWWYVKHWYPANPNHKKVFKLIPFIGFDSRVFDGDDCCAWETVRLSPRKLLQLLGTEGGREIIHPNIWINALFAEYKKTDLVRGFSEKREDGKLYVPEGHGEHVGKEVSNLEFEYRKSPKWIITDVRFPDEVKAIEDRGGIVIRVDDSNMKIGNIHDEVGITTKGAWRAASVGFEHESETALDNYEFTHTVQNDGSIEDLVEKINQLDL